MGQVETSHTTVLNVVLELHVESVKLPPYGTLMVYHTSDDGCPKKLFAALSRFKVDPETAPTSTIKAKHCFARESRYPQAIFVNHCRQYCT